MTKRAVLIIGAKSDIGRALARRFAADGYSIRLAARRAVAYPIAALRFGHHSAAREVNGPLTIFLTFSQSDRSGS